MINVTMRELASEFLSPYAEDDDPLGLAAEWHERWAGHVLIRATLVDDGHQLTLQSPFFPARDNEARLQAIETVFARAAAVLQQRYKSRPISSEN